jgi:hypothetical protein
MRNLKSTFYNFAYYGNATEPRPKQFSLTWPISHELTRGQVV